MNKTEHAPATSSRRGLLMGLAAAAVVPAPALTTALGNTDPILAAIDAHKAAERAFSNVLTEQSALETQLPDAFRESTVDAHGEHIVETDDPRWIANQRAVDKASDEGFDRALELLDIRPTTMAGLVSLFSYVAKLESLPAVLLDEREYDFPNALLLTAAGWLENPNSLQA